MTKPERWIAIILPALSTMLIGQVAVNTAPDPEPQCMTIKPEGIVPCAISAS